jgi:hypothetical protein
MVRYGSREPTCSQIFLDICPGQFEEAGSADAGSAVLGGTALTLPFTVTLLSAHRQSGHPYGRDDGKCL